MKGHQSVLFLTACISLFLAADATFLRNLAEKAEGKQDEPGVYVPMLSHKFSDYEMNGDGFIDYEEFISPLMMKFNIQNPMIIRGPFSEADADGDGKLNKEEFAEFRFNDSTDEGEKEERGCHAYCRIVCNWWFICNWQCSAGC